MVYNKKKTLLLFIVIYSALVHMAWPRGAVGSASDSRARGPGFDTKSGHILTFPLSLIQEGQLLVTAESMCTKFNGFAGLSLSRNSVVRLTYRSDMTVAVTVDATTTTSFK